MDKREMKLFKRWYNQAEEGDYEFRLIADKGGKDKRFVAIEEVNESLLAQFIEGDKREGINVYLCAAPRGYKFGMEKGMQDVTQLSTPPSNAILSGNDNHAYFKFNGPFVVNTLEDLQYVKKLGKRLHLFINVDYMVERWLGNAILCFIEGLTDATEGQFLFKNAILLTAIQVIRVEEVRIEVMMCRRLCMRVMQRIAPFMMPRLK